jgi:hypothetical protein
MPCHHAVRAAAEDAMLILAAAADANGRKRTAQRAMRQRDRRALLRQVAMLCAVR